MDMDFRDALRARIDSKINSKLLNRQLGLENLKRHSFQNVTTGNKSNSGKSSVRSGSVEDSRLNAGKPTLIPFVYNGRSLDLEGPAGIREAIDRAVDSGLVFPAFDTNTEATAASKKLSNRLGRSKSFR